MIDNEESFISKGLTPKISMKIKATRTVFCAGFDSSLFRTYPKEDIHRLMAEMGWQVRGVHILSNNKAMKIEFKNRDQARKFLIEDNTNIGGIRINKTNKEIEVDPTVRQCWTCGKLDPGHNSENCHSTQRCMKCGREGHRFFECSIPSERNKMNETHKQEQFCIPCNNQGSHTSLDFGLCPKKREIVRERARVARRAREESDIENERDVELIKKVIAQSESEWPSIHRNTQHSHIATMITLALIDEAVNPGVFQNKLDRACEDNNLQKVKYELEPNTALEFYNTITGTGKHTIPPDTQQTQKQNLEKNAGTAGGRDTATPRAGAVRSVRSKDSGKGTHIISVDTGKDTQQRNMLSRYARDNMGMYDQLHLYQGIDNSEVTNKNSKLKKKTRESSLPSVTEKSSNLYQKTIEDNQCIEKR